MHRLIFHCISDVVRSVPRAPGWPRRPIQTEPVFPELNRVLYRPMDKVICWEWYPLTFKLWHDDIPTTIFRLKTHDQTKMYHQLRSQPLLQIGSCVSKMFHAHLFFHCSWADSGMMIPWSEKSYDMLPSLWDRSSDRSSVACVHRFDNVSLLSNVFNFPFSFNYRDDQLFATLDCSSDDKQYHFQCWLVNS